MTQNKQARKNHLKRKRSRAKRRWAIMRPKREAAATAFSDFWQAMAAA